MTVPKPSGLLRWRAQLTGVVVVLVAAIAGGAKAEVDPLANRFGGPFTLQSSDKTQISDTDFRGRFMLVYFGYTHCPDICPTELSVMTEALDALGSDADSIQPIFVTVDPQRDTEELLAEYRKSFHSRFVMLTGDEKAIAAAAKAYKVHRRKFLWRADAAPADDYGVDHGSIVYLMGRDGAFVTLFPHGTSAQKMTDVLRKYVKQHPSE